MDKTKIAIQIFDQHAQAYQDQFMDVSRYRDSLNLFCRSVGGQDAAILELACGPGNITRHLLQKRPDFKILATDLSANMLEFAKANNPGADFRVMDCRDVGQLEAKFDGVVCGFGLPYLSRDEALKLIEDTAGVLTPGGVFYLSTMEDDYDKSGWKGPASGGPERMFIYYHQADYLMEAFRENGFEVLNVNRKEYRASDGGWTKDLIVVVKGGC